MTEAYQTLCELWASPEYQKIEKKRMSGACSRKAMLGGDGYVCLGQQMVNPHLYFFHKHMYNHMLLIVTCGKLRLVLHLYRLTCITRGIRN
jgi:hypothetical protein